MTTTQWDAVNQFVETVGWEFIFGLNSVLRSHGVWDSKNGALLMSYSNSKGYKVQWELGNGTCIIISVVCIYCKIVSISCDSLSCRTHECSIALY